MQNPIGKKILRDIPSPTSLGPGIKLFPVTGIKQRERNLLRQLLYVTRDLRARSRRSACLHTHLTCCQNHTAPMQAQKYKICTIYDDKWIEQVQIIQMLKYC
jgi:hypothetical protein